jgi:hypothetical protein
MAYLGNVSPNQLLNAIGLKQIETRSAFAEAVVPVTLFGTGILIGAGLALMLAPKSGRELRKDLTKQAKQLSTVVRERMPTLPLRTNEPGMSFLFFLTRRPDSQNSPWRLGLPGARESALVECSCCLGASGAPITARENPRERAVYVQPHAWGFDRDAETVCSAPWTLVGHAKKRAQNINAKPAYALAA